MKLLLLCWLFILVSEMGQCQIIDSTGESEWTEENEKQIITEEFNANQYPNLPSRSKDLKNLMPPPGKQGKQGSCWAWATTYAMRSSMDNPGNPRFFLDAQGKLDSNKVYSPSYTYQYYKGDRNDCNFGNYSAKILDSVLRNGAISLRQLSYNEANCNFRIQDNITRSARANSKLGYDVFYLQDLHSAKKVLSDGQPLVISIRLGDGFDKLKDVRDTGQIIIWKDFGRRKGSHAMVCVAYDDSLKAIKVLNSWGDQWAMQGYCWIDYNIVEQSMNYFCYPKKTTEKKITKQEDVTEKIVEQAGSKWPVFGMLNAWFKEGYFVRFEKFKIVLADLNPNQKNAVVEIRDEQYNFLKNFSIVQNSTANFYIGDQQYAFTLEDIAHRGRNPLKKAAVFKVEKVKAERE